MVEGDKKRFAVLMASLGVAFDAAPTRERMALYWEALKARPISSPVWAVGEAIRTLRWFPKAVELIELSTCAPRNVLDQGLVEQKRRLLIEDLIPPDVARENLVEMVRQLNARYGTTFSVGEVRGRPELVSVGGDKGQ